MYVSIKGGRGRGGGVEGSTRGKKRGVSQELGAGQLSYNITEPFIDMRGKLRV